MSIEIVTKRHGTARNVVPRSNHNSDAADLHLEDVDDGRERLTVNDLGVVRQTRDDRRLDEVAFPVDTCAIIMHPNNVWVMYAYVKE